MPPISRVALRMFASSAFELLSGSQVESAETAVRSISIGAASAASRSITCAVSEWRERAAQRGGWEGGGAPPGGGGGEGGGAGRGGGGARAGSRTRPPRRRPGR